MPTICLVNYATVKLPWTMGQLAASLQQYITGFVGPAWGQSATIEVVDPPAAVPAGDWPLYLFNNSNVPGALGYHQDAGSPQGFAFVEDTMDYGDDPAVTVSHECAEMIVDSRCDYYTPGTGGYWYIVEVCDPVEGDSFSVSGLQMSNFILPSWYESNAVAGTRLDHLGKLQTPFSLDAGGYYSYWYPTTGWSQEFGSLDAEWHFKKFKATSPFGRYVRRLAKSPLKKHPGRPRKK